MKNSNISRTKAFTNRNIRSVCEPGSMHYLKKRASFWIAALSLFTFLAGNMIGQHGWYAFFASVLGDGDDSAIVYAGTVLPVKEMVDYECWVKYGGDFKEHTFRESPASCRIAPPKYVSGEHELLISMEYMSGYHSGEEGSGLHSGVDYRVPVGTPVQTVMNARVVRVVQSSPGFGMFIVLRHPNAPDPSDPTKTTTLYTTYAHLSATYVTEGEVIQKGDTIALSGNSGNTTGPHLHFQMDRADAPFVPYAAGTLQDGYQYTVNPLLYVQQNYSPVATVVATNDNSSVSSESSSNASSVRSAIKRDVVSMVALLKARREQRIAARAHRRTVVASRLQTGLLPSAPAVVESKPETIVASDTTVVTATEGEVASVRFVHDGSFTGRGWEKLRVTLYDVNGNEVLHPKLPSDLKIVAAFGEAEFRPATLSALDFVNGEAQVFVLPRGRRTLVLQAIPFAETSEPFRYEE